ncbi:hypothetical protein RvY_11950-4 [Ramazzottius varieornatus]|uniref:Uncharacterized protein n=1 Tax=Ramazzottius varieornatus TaxID=947166 RepID=A0A1D1VK83_RAMVA|nr:hypothetical protein RvY_11950-4 [Ramazzottius varieornatus]
MTAQGSQLRFLVFVGSVRRNGMAARVGRFVQKVRSTKIVDCVPYDVPYRAYGSCLTSDMIGSTEILVVVSAVIGNAASFSGSSRPERVELGRSHPASAFLQ